MTAEELRNQRQYRITRSWARRFAEGVANLEAAPLDEDVSPELRDLELRALRSQLASLEDELADYEHLATAASIPVDNLDDLGPALVRARIAAGITQAELTARLGVTPRVIQRYEANDYRQASLARITEVGRALHLDLDALLTLRSA